MRWEDFRRSENVEDRRGDTQYAGGGGGSSGHLGIGAMIILGLIGYAFGIDPRLLIGGAELVSNVTSGSGKQQTAPSKPMGAPNDQMGHFVSAVLAENEDVWKEVLPAQTGVRFVPAPVVLFQGGTRSGCGIAQSAMGPFYCPEDRKIYLDTAFFKDMQKRLGGGGDFAYAYVISHEMGHHVQNLLGILPKAQAAQQNAGSKAQANAISVRVELQADCLAGVWAANAHQKWQVIEEGDVEKAMATAQAIGDDRLQKSGRGYAVPDSFTHGSSAQRVQWLERGLQSGKVSACNTFGQ
ncbi:neutral zinc metallopeptidase [uncultured Rhodoblastus sp.]|uniref:KPN_02809 family neutral zinc metallopeptidase n=1 Tax=uncultured Rhodoblastus sp. TaxID=543037 RepID=UPI0025D873F9|nr:neutral zinc metallopeptidase [uncultured Rhodoblastus sp.]